MLLKGVKAAMEYWVDPLTINKADEEATKYLEQKRKDAIDILGDKWILSKYHMKKRLPNPIHPILSPKVED